eukprot:evm.model.NODE_3984_length_32566_cov_17.902445.2
MAATNKSRTPSPAPSKEVLAQLQNPTNLEALLLQLTAPDTQVIQQAEAVVKKYVKSPICVAGLVQQMQGSKYIQVRQLAAMLLRRRLGPLWSKLDTKTKEALKVALLQAVTGEQERAIRKNMASVIAVAARKLLSKNKWNELLAFIYQYSQAELEDHRELAFVILNELAETLGKSFESQFPSLKQVYQICAVLEESEGEVVWEDDEDEDGGGVGQLLNGLDEDDEDDGEVDLGVRGVFQEQLPCQQTLEDEDDGLDDEDKETSRDLIEAGADLRAGIHGIAKFFT